MKKIHIIIVSVAVILMGLIGYRVYQDMADKRRFEKAEQEIVAFERAMDVDQSKVKVENICSYPSHKFQTVSPGCTVEHRIKTSYESRDNLRKITIDELSLLGWNHKRSSDDTSESTEVGNTGTDFFSGKSIDSCFTDYIQDSRDKALTLRIMCSGKARGEWYPVRG